MGFSPIQSVRKFFHDLKTAPDNQYRTEASAPSMIAAATILLPPEKAHFAQEEKSWLDLAAKEQAAVLPPRPKKQKTSALDVAVKAAGSRWALLFTLLLLIAWGIWGAVAGPSDTWQVILQDVSSIQAYISATLLMRQQQSSCRGVLNRICSLISRSESNEAMLKTLTPEHRAQLKLNKHRLKADVLASLQTSEDLLDKISNWVSIAAGSLIFLGIYWLGIIGWVFSGIPLQFSDTWQLDVNTATALEITLTTMFLQNIRQQHDDRMERCVKSIDKIDEEIEVALRQMTGSREPNPTIKSTPPKHTRATRGLDTYAFIFGGSVGVVISVIVFALWIAVGDPMEFDDNWFLIIGTYTGLMGFIDGFVMKNVDHREAALTNIHFERLVDQDYKVFRLLDIEMPATEKKKKLSLNQRMSGAIGHACGTTIASYGSFVATFALIIIASAMQWTETGQLLCNTPTMIFEGFLLITLMQAHNMEDASRRVIYDDILMRRLVLESHFSSWDNAEYVIPELFRGEKAELISMFDKNQQALADALPEYREKV